MAKAKNTNKAKNTTSQTAEEIKIAAKIANVQKASSIAAASFGSATGYLRQIQVEVKGYNLIPEFNANYDRIGKIIKMIDTAAAGFNKRSVSVTKKLKKSVGAEERATKAAEKKAAKIVKIKEQLKKAQARLDKLQS